MLWHSSSDHEIITHMKQKNNFYETIVEMSILPVFRFPLKNSAAFWGTFLFWNFCISKIMTRTRKGSWTFLQLQELREKIQRWWSRCVLAALWKGVLLLSKLDAVHSPTDSLKRDMMLFILLLSWGLILMEISLTVWSWKWSRRAEFNFEDIRHNRFLIF